jgi:protein phosphatase
MPRSVGKTDTGQARKQNEDAYLRDDELGLYVVADGMGKDSAGAIASVEAIEQVHGMVKRGFDHVEQMRRSSTPATRQSVRRLLESAVQAATYMVFGMAELDPTRKGMGTTISSLLVVNNHAFIAQVGDSRVYVVRNGVAIQITEDHTLVSMQLRAGTITKEQAHASPYSHLVTRAVGLKDYVEVDTFEVESRPGDRFVLCSDGLHGYLDDEASDLSDIPMELQLADAAQHLVTLANARGGKDNITVLIVEMYGSSSDETTSLITDDFDVPRG